MCNRSENSDSLYSSLTLFTSGVNFFGFCFCLFVFLLCALVFGCVWSSSEEHNISTKDMAAGVETQRALMGFLFVISGVSFCVHFDVVFRVENSCGKELSAGETDGGDKE